MDGHSLSLYGLDLRTYCSSAKEKWHGEMGLEEAFTKKTQHVGSVRPMAIKGPQEITDPGQLIGQTLTPFLVQGHLLSAKIITFCLPALSECSV